MSSLPLPDPLPAKDVYLPSRPSLPLAVYSYEPRGARKIDPLVCCVNGMVAPMAGWKGVFDRLGGKYRLLAFDRYGHGQSAASQIEEPHDVVDVARYASELIELHLGTHAEAVPLVFVGNSIGVPIARLLLDRFMPIGTRLAGMLMCDSMIASTDFVSLLPAPSAGEDPSLTAAREGVRKVFHPTAPNKEGLDRSKLPQLLPHADQPALPHTPFLTVLAQDHHFSSATVDRMSPGMTAAIYLTYTAPAWAIYNQGPVKLSESRKVRGPITVPDANHFIQVTRPDVVAQELDEIMQRVLAKNAT